MKKLFIFLILGIFLISIVSAADWDNKLSYSNEDLKVTISNSFLLLFPTSEIGTAELKSHPSVDYVKKVGAGNQIVMWYDLNFAELYLNGLGEVEFTDMRTGEEIDKDYSFVYWGEKERDVYGQGDCSFSINGTKTCETIVVGKETYEAWLPYNSLDIPKGNIRIGLMTYVEIDDKVDGVWTIAGKKVKKHATWTAELNVGLLAYYTLDESSGDAIDSLGNYNLTNSGVNQGESGLINNSARWDGGTADRLSNTDFPDTTASVNMWVNVTSMANYDTLFLLNDESNDFNIYYANGLVVSGYDGSVHTTAPVYDYSGNLNAWTMVTYVENGTMNLWINGTHVAQGATASFVWGTVLIGLGNHISLSRAPYGKIDEVGIWSRTLTSAEIIQLYNSGVGITYGAFAELEITLLSPDDNANLTTNNINFSANVSDPGLIGIQNVTIEVFNSTSLVFNETNTSGIEGVYNFSDTFTDGDYDWNVTAYNDIDEKQSSSTRSFSIDTIDPVINISYPNETITFHAKNTNLSLNWTATDEHLSSCWYNWDGTNVSVTCGDNSTSFNITDGTNKNLIFYANDTFGHEISQIVTWDYRLFLKKEIFDSIIIEGSESIFSANFLTNGSDITIAILYYNETTNTGTISTHGGNNFTISKTIFIPSVGTDTNLPFYWNITQGLLNFVLDPKNQTVLNLGIDDCSVFSTLIFNYTIVDEEKQDFLEDPFNTTLELDLDLFSLDKSRLISSFSKSYGDTNPATVCLNINLTNDTIFSSDSIIRYEALNHTNEYYNLQSFTLENSTIPQVITLYSLLSTDSTEFQITFKDSNFAVVEDALIQINRQYISEGVFKTVEIPKTDANGQTVAHLVEKEVIYNFIVIKDNVILGTFNNVIAFCQDAYIGNCFISLNAIKAGTVVFDYDEEIGLAFSFSYNESSRLLQFPFTTLDGGVKNVSLLAIKLDQLGNTTACSQSLVTSSGTISCSVPVSIGNATLIVEIFVEGDLRITNYIQTGTPFDLGDIGYFLMFFLVLSLALMMTQSKIAVILGVVLGFISSTLLSFVKGGILAIGSSITWLVIMAIILIWKLNSQAQT